MVGQGTSCRAPSNSMWGRRYDPWCPVGLPFFGVEEILIDYSCASTAAVLLSIHIEKLVRPERDPHRYREDGLSLGSKLLSTA